MRQLTLIGFLCGYVRSLADCGALNIHKLVGEVYSGNLRLKEPLFLYCFYSDRSHVLLKYLDNADKEEYRLAASALKDNNTALLPAAYVKVLNSYERRIGMKDNDNRIKSMMIDRIIRLKKQKNVSSYRIYTELGINGGNFNDFLKNRNLNRLSLDKSREVIDYLQRL